MFCLWGEWFFFFLSFDCLGFDLRVLVGVGVGVGDEADFGV